MGGDSEKEALVIGAGDFWVAPHDRHCGQEHSLGSWPVHRKVLGSIPESGNPPPSTPETTVKTVCPQLSATCLPEVEE